MAPSTLLALVFAILVADGEPLEAQQTRSVVPLPEAEKHDAKPSSYRPSLEVPEGRERIAVFYSSRFCIANTQPGFYGAVRRMKVLLAAQARTAGQPFSITGVSIDWKPQDGIAYLQRLGPFDELLVGRNWYGFGTRVFTRGDSTAPNVIPQVILLERDVHLGKRGDHREVARILGGDSIMGWVKRGAPWPAR